jgi:hypothetical protein
MLENKKKRKGNIQPTPFLFLSFNILALEDKREKKSKRVKYNTQCDVGK